MCHMSWTLLYSKSPLCYQCGRRKTPKIIHIFVFSVVTVMDMSEETATQLMSRRHSLLPVLQSGSQTFSYSVGEGHHQHQASMSSTLFYAPGRYV